MISAIVLTRNVEKNIIDCLESLVFCNDIIVIDDNSSDRTVELAKKMKAKVYTRPLDNDFFSQRNFGLDKAQSEWVLFIDADERISASLQNEILSVISSQNGELLNLCGFRIKRVDFMWGKKLKYGETANIRLLRLARKNSGQWQGKVHEVWKVKGKVGELRHPLLHYPHKTIKEFLEDINFYTNLRAQELYEKGVKADFWSIILYPTVKFFVNYILRRGFIDGIPGFVFATIMSFHSFLVRAKLWLLWQKRI